MRAGFFEQFEMRKQLGWKVSAGPPRSAPVRHVRGDADRLRGLFGLALCFLYA
jgi:hypothetical protein